MNELNNLESKEEALDSAGNDQAQVTLRRPVWLFFLLGVVGVAVVAAAGVAVYTFMNNGSLPAAEVEQEENEQSQADDSRKLFDFMLTKPAFAQPQNIPDTFTPTLPAQWAAVAELDNLDSFAENGIELSDAQLKALAETGFFLTENDVIGSQESGTDDFADAYAYFSGSSNKYYREADDALYISSDAALHLYHLLVDRSFQKIEEEKFYPRLRGMTKTLFVDSINNYSQTSDPNLKEAYMILSAYYLIPLVVLDAAADPVKLDPSQFETYARYLAAEEAQNEQAGQTKLEFSLDAPSYDNISLSDEVFELAQSELKLIAEATGLEESPLFTPYRPYLLNDYSQFKPRSHYTKNDHLKSYFIAMMWYGRMGFSLDSAALTRAAIAATGQLNTLSADGTKLTDMYNSIATAIEFFVGEVDDLTPYEYTNVIEEQFGQSMTAGELSSDKTITEFVQAGLKDFPLPRIVSEAVALYDDGGEREALLRQLLQFRFMGQRFTPDAYVLNNLTQGVGAPDPETGQNLPQMTTALMPVYVITDNTLVKDYIDDWVSVNAPDSDLIIDKKLSELRQEFDSYPEDTWTQNMYWGWLNSYRSLLTPYGQGYPAFMTTTAWQKKNLGTVLGSYTELKHDTLLYAKQSYAELGGGGDNPEELPPVPKGYVEADYVFWSRITELARVTNKGLTRQGLMPEAFQYRFDTFVEYSQFFRDLVKQELNNEVISDEDFEKLRVSGHAFKRLAEALPGEELTTKERRAGIIADIHTDAVNREILYEATGKPYLIYVAVTDQNGTRLTRGLAYNHYELTGPLTERYSDEDWQERVYAQDNLPPADEWSQDLIK